MPKSAAAIACGTSTAKRSSSSNRLSSRHRRFICLTVSADISLLLACHDSECCLLSPERCTFSRKSRWQPALRLFSGQSVFFVIVLSYFSTLKICINAPRGADANANK